MNIINWETVFKKSQEFKNQQPFKFGYIKNIFTDAFYESLYGTYPKIDDFTDGSDMSKTQFVMQWGKSNYQKLEPVLPGSDERFSENWNKLKLYAESEEFIGNWRMFSGVPVNKLKHFKFIAYSDGGFQLPHTHNVGPSTLVMMFYFSKGWKDGEAGGTYMATDEDESTIIFEPYDLDNTLALFHDSPNSAHGTRMVTNGIQRNALQITLEEFNETNGWSGGNQKLYP
tara:strand:- start:9980 stop:10663 length:684 start_codon:yes stop_codon:yes gene_type:complete